jgi:Ca2+-binding RTX toxin-like protein
MGETSFHAEWDDGEQDILKGGFGLDTYYIAHDQIYRETTGTLAEQLELIDVIDERDGDGRGSLVIQHRLDETTYSIASAGEYELSWQDEDGSWYQKIDFEFGRDLTVLVSTLLDENNNPLVFLIPAFESLDIAYAAIKGFRQGDFGIDLAGYIGPKEGTDGDDVILNDGSGGSLRSAATQSDSVTLDSDPDANQRIDAGAGNDIVYGRGGQDELRGGDGDDQLFGGDDDDLLNGGTDDDHLQGDDGNDIFLFRSNFGHDTITDFVAGEGSDDIIDTDVFADFASVLAAATQVGDDTLITADANNSILLKNIAVGNLHQDDFRFSTAA